MNAGFGLNTYHYAEQIRGRHPALSQALVAIVEGRRAQLFKFTRWKMVQQELVSNCIAKWRREVAALEPDLIYGDGHLFEARVIKLSKQVLDAQKLDPKLPGNARTRKKLEARLDTLLNEGPGPTAVQLTMFENENDVNS